MRRHAIRLVLVFVITLAAGALPAAGGETDESTGPRDVRSLVAIDQGRIGAAVPAKTQWTNEFGETVTLERYLHEVPILLVPVYYACPNLCGVTLAGLFTGLNEMPLQPGRDYRVVAVSIDPREGPAEAARAKSGALKLFPHRAADAAFHFLTGSGTAVAAITEAIGFEYGWDAAIEQYAHAAAVAVVSPDGRVARWLYGVQYDPLDLRLALTEAGRGTIGGITEQLLLMCYRYDPATGQYGSIIHGALRAGGVLTVLTLGGFIAISLYRERAQRRTAGQRDA